MARALAENGIAFNPTYSIIKDVGLWGWGTCFPIVIRHPRNRNPHTAGK